MIGSPDPFSQTDRDVEVDADQVAIKSRAIESRWKVICKFVSCLASPTGF